MHTNRFLTSSSETSVTDQLLRHYFGLQPGDDITLSFIKREIRTASTSRKVLSLFVSNNKTQTNTSFDPVWPISSCSEVWSPSLGWQTCRRWGNLQRVKAKTAEGNTREGQPSVHRAGEVISTLLHWSSKAEKKKDTSTKQEKEEPPLFGLLQQVLILDISVTPPIQASILRKSQTPIGVLWRGQQAHGHGWSLDIIYFPFNKVALHRLLRKLSYNCIRMKPLIWINNWLRDRKQR